MSLRIHAADPTRSQRDGCHINRLPNEKRTMSQKSLAHLIASHSPSNEPMPLPSAHLTTVKSLDSILTTGKVIPTHCTVFGRDVLYLFYGGVLYRPSKRATKNTFELPIGFLFDPS